MNYRCVFCGEETLISRQVDSKVFQICCTSCGARGPYGECVHEAEWLYSINNLKEDDTDPEARNH